MPVQPHSISSTCQSRLVWAGVIYCLLRMVPVFSMIKIGTFQSIWYCVGCTQGLSSRMPRHITFIRTSESSS